MKYQPLFALFLTLAALACDSEEYPYCYGVNETNMPPKVLLVENARDAATYTLQWNDPRLYSTGGSELIGDNEDYLIMSKEGCSSDAEHECLGFGLPSCGKLDPLGNLETLHITHVDRKNGQGAH